MQVDLRRRGLQSFDPAEFAHTDEHLHLLLQVRQLDLSHNSLHAIRGLEGLTHLTVLNISHNGLRSLGGGLPLTLQELDASHNNLASLQNAALLPLQSLTSLNVSFNDLEDLRGVPNVTAQLTYLDVRCNRLSSLIGIEHCGQLRTLHAESNLLREVADVASLKCLSLLSAVFLSGNPLLLRKRLLTQLHLLLPSSVEQNDLPTTAPPSSVRSSTAAPPSLPDTSSVGSLDYSTMASISEYREEGRCGSGHNARPASANQGTAPSMLDTTGIHDSSATLERRAPRHAHSSSSPRTHHRLPHRGTSNSARPLCLSAAAPPTTTASVASTGVVGGASDSLACPRRALPHEHRLTETPGSPSMSSSPDRTHASWSPGPLHSSNGRGSLTASLFPGSASSPHQQGAVGAAPQVTRYGERHSSELVRDDLEEQLARVTAERDDYRREVVALRRELRELRRTFARQCSQERAEDPEELTQASVRSAAAAAAPGHGEGDSSGAHRKSRHPQQEQQQQQKRSPSVRILAVEMSAHSSLCSQDGESDTPGPPNNNRRNAPQNSAAMSNSAAMLHSCRRLFNTLPFVPMALSTLDILEHRLQAAGLGGTTSTAPTPKSRAGPSATGNYSAADKADQLKWFSSSLDAPFFISPKHDGVRLISYVPPASPTEPPSPQQASSTTKKTGATTGESPPLMTCYSRYGRPIYGLFWIEEELRLLRALCGDASLIIDGELYLHQTDMDAPRASRGGRPDAPDGRKKNPARRTLPSSDADGANNFNTGFLAVSALVNRCRSSTCQCASEEGVLKYVPSLPRLCVFDVPSYSPSANPLAPPTRDAPTALSAASRLHIVAKVSVKDDGGSQQVLAELQRVRSDVTDALRLNDLEQLRIVPNVTPFSQRLRTMHYLFELLSRAMESPVLRQHFCPTSARMCAALTTRSIRGCRKHTSTGAQAQQPHSGIGQHHGGRFVSRIPYQLVKSLEDTTQRVLPVYLDAGYEGAVIRAPVNTYDFKEKTKGTLAALVAPLLRAAETTTTRRARHLRGTNTGAGEASGRRARNRAAMLLSLNTRPVLGAATPLMVHAYRGNAPCCEPMQPISPSDAGLTDAELDVLDVVAVGRRAILQGAKLPLRSMTAVKVLPYHDREYPILRPLLKEPSKNPRTRELVSIPRSHVRALGYPIKPTTDTALSDDNGATTLTPATSSGEKKATKRKNHPTTSGEGSTVFYGLQCLAENGLVFNVSLPKMTLAQQKTLLQHLLSAGRDAMRDGREAASPTMKTHHNKKSKAKAPYGGATHAGASKIVSLTGLYATVKFSTLTEHGLPRFGSVKAIRGGKGWFI